MELFKYASSLYLIGLTTIFSAKEFQLNPFYMNGIIYGFVFTMFIWIFIYKTLNKFKIANEFNSFFLGISVIIGVISILKLALMPIIFGSFTILIAIILMNIHFNNIYHGVY